MSNQMDILTDGRDRVQMKLFSVERPGGFGRDFRIRSTRDGPQLDGRTC